ncbi:type II toxin-antitoxin system HicA family toxin [Mammaliicoccus sp. Dog046]|uniref:type II toxin-antitoxin system HicA family toxin n=1 Tax=Mammaliicoccus sp. Dog046 TaxID=3034233 RepID=UPI002B258838|nr:type II toxin-antitoxin system HicA family toxin [Mammaliicoccus sp. Dog046]WQK85008.1 type II toxin-antitoxin system HicA family toxin [Mammaliicoccus sp. Dog046]
MSSSREVIKKLENDGWYLVKIIGSHHHFKHPERIGKITDPHQKKDLPYGTERAILKQAGLFH